MIDVKLVKLATLKDKKRRVPLYEDVFKTIGIDILPRRGTLLVTESLVYEVAAFMVILDNEPKDYYAIVSDPYPVDV